MRSVRSRAKRSVLPAGGTYDQGMDSEFMERALELAERGRGTTHPNPLVGAVVVVGGEVVGEGWHERKGGPHAEVNALTAAGEQARGGVGALTHTRLNFWLRSLV